MLNRRADEAGFVQFLFVALAAIALVIGVIVAIMLGLNGMYRERSGKSMFGEDAGITEIGDKLRSKRDELKAKFAADEDAPASVPARAKSSDQRLDDINRRLKAHHGGRGR